MKKDPYKFTLHLNANDPRHVRVAEYLNSLGHKMGGTIVDALLFYMEKGAPTGTIHAPALTRDQIRQLVYDILRRQGRAGESVQEDGAMSARIPGAVCGQKAVEAVIGEKAAEGRMKDSVAFEARKDGSETGSVREEHAEKGAELEDAALNKIADALKMFGDM